MSVSNIFSSQRREFKRQLCNSRDSLYRMACAWTHDPHLADDLVQQTMFKALNNQRQLRDPSTIQAWLFRILANCLTDYHRAKRDFLSDEELPDLESRTPERLSQEQQLVDKVRHKVGQLPLSQRQIVTLVDLEGLAYSTVAEILDIPVGTVMSRLCRGRQALKELLMDIKPHLLKERTIKLKRIK